MAAARKPSETFNPYSGVIFIELFTLPLNKYMLISIFQNKPEGAKFPWLFFILLFPQNALFSHQFHHAHVEIRTTLFQPDHQIPNVLASHEAVSLGTYQLHLHKA